MSRRSSSEGTEHESPMIRPTQLGEPRLSGLALWTPNSDSEEDDDYYTPDTKRNNVHRNASVSSLSDHAPPVVRPATTTGVRRNAQSMLNVSSLISPPLSPTASSADLTALRSRSPDTADSDFNKQFRTCCTLDAALDKIVDWNGSDASREKIVDSLIQSLEDVCSYAHFAEALRGCFERRARGSSVRYLVDDAAVRLRADDSFAGSSFASSTGSFSSFGGVSRVRRLHSSDLSTTARTDSASSMRLEILDSESSDVVLWLLERWLFTHKTLEALEVSDPPLVDAICNFLTASNSRQCEKTKDRIVSSMRANNVKSAVPKGLIPTHFRNRSDTAAIFASFAESPTAVTRKRADSCEAACGARKDDESSSSSSSSDSEEEVPTRPKGLMRALSSPVRTAVRRSVDVRHATSSAIRKVSSVDNLEKGLHVLEKKITLATPLSPLHPSLSAKKTAAALHARSYRAFSKLRVAHLRPSRPTDSDYVDLLKKDFNRISAWPCNALFSTHKNNLQRINILAWYVDVAAESRRIGDYQTLFALVAGLTSPTLYWLWEIAHRRDKSSLEKLKKLCGDESGYRIYRNDVSKFRGTKLVPFLGTMLGALQHNDRVSFVEGGTLFVDLGACLARHERAYVYLTKDCDGVSPLVEREVDVAAALDSVVLDFSRRSEMSSAAKKHFLKSVGGQFHRARAFTHTLR